MTPVQDRVRASSKTVAALVLLTIALPVNAALTAIASLRSLVVPPTRAAAADPKTVMISGGEMTKALQLARSFHRAGHRVILIESAKYRMTGHRFSRSVARFYPVPDSGAPGYADALVRIVEREAVDVYVPVCSPVASLHDAQAKDALSRHCEVLHVDPELVTTLDDKHAFSMAATEAGVSVPESRRITDARQVIDFDFRNDRTYVMKSIAYDPIRRLDLTQLPCDTPDETAAFVRELPLSDRNPWIMQEFIEGREYCTHSTVRDGQLRVYGCCPSSASQLNYQHVDKPEIEAWVRTFVSELAITGQVSFDFMEAADGQIYAIECNPRTHSAITMFYDHPELASAYLGTTSLSIMPLATSRPTYWLYHELWRLLAHPKTIAQRLGVILRGKEAIFDWADPLPFLMVHHVQIPWLLVRNLRAGTGWTKIDFNIGKLVEPAGD